MGHLAVTVPGTVFSSIWVTKGTRTVAAVWPPPPVTPAVELAPLPSPLWKATVAGSLVPGWLMGPDAISWPPACPRRAWNSEMMQPRRASKVLARVLSWRVHATYTLNRGLLQARGFGPTQPGWPSALTGVFILRPPNQFYRLSCHHKSGLTWMQGRSHR